MARVKKTSGESTMTVSYIALQKDVEYGLANSIEDAKENAIKRIHRFFGKKTNVQFTGMP